MTGVFSQRPIRLVLGFSPGSASDSLARALAPELSATLGQPVMVELHPGVNGATGAQRVAKSNVGDGFFLRAEPDNIEPS